MDDNSIRLIRQQLLETASCSLLPEGYREKNDAKYDVRSRWFSRSSPRLPGFGIVARVIVVRLYVLEQLDKTAAVFGGSSLPESRTAKLCCAYSSQFLAL